MRKRRGSCRFRQSPPATINQIRAFLIVLVITVRKGEISPRMRCILRGLYGDWKWMDDRIDTVSNEIEEISRTEENCVNVMTVPRIWDRTNWQRLCHRCHSRKTAREVFHW
jgi:hypothetical protein